MKSRVLRSIARRKLLPKEAVLYRKNPQPLRVSEKKLSLLRSPTEKAPVMRMVLYRKGPSSQGSI